MKILLSISAVLFCIVTLVHGQEERPSEDERCELWYQDGNVWPPTWQEESETLKEKMITREAEIMQITGSSERSPYFNLFNQIAFRRFFILTFKGGKIGFNTHNPD
jgi:hypothetical protein